MGRGRNRRKTPEMSGRAEILFITLSKGRGKYNT